MTTIVTRASNAAPLSNAQMDTNLTNLNNDKLEKSNNLSDLTNTTNARSNLGLGTMATQAATAVNIDGGTIDGTVIGGTTPAAGSFTTLIASVSAGASAVRASATGGGDALEVVPQASGGGAIVQSTNAAGSAFAHLYAKGTTVNIGAGASGTTVGAFSSTGLSVTGSLSATGNATFGEASGRRADYNVGNGAWIIRNGVSGGWSQGYNIASNDGSTSVAQFGAYGGASGTSDFVYIAAQGQDYINPTVKVSTTGVAVTGALSASVASKAPYFEAIGDDTAYIFYSLNSAASGALDFVAQHDAGSIKLGANRGSLKLLANGIVGATLDAAGNLGLGVTPSAWSSAGWVQATGFMSKGTSTYSGTNTYYNGGWRYATDGFATLCSQIDGAYSWSSAPSGTAGNFASLTNKMTLDAGGNLSIGMTPGAYIDQNGNWFGSNGTSGVSHATGTASGAHYTYFSYGGTPIGSITQSGTTAVAYNTTSDHRLKENVRPANAARFNDIEFVDFEWVDGRHDCGVIAHQLASVYPDLVIGEKDATEIRAVEIEPAIPAVTEQVLVTEAVFNDDGEEIEPAVYETVEITPAVEAVMEDQEFPVYQQVNYIGLIGRMGTRIQIQDKQLTAQAELIAAMEARLAALEAA